MVTSIWRCCCWPSFILIFWILLSDCYSKKKQCHVSCLFAFSWVFGRIGAKTMWYSNCVLYKQTLLSSLDSRKDRWQGGQYEDCALWYSQYIEHNYRNSWKKPCQKSFDTGRNHGLRLSQEDDEVRLSLSSLTSTSVIDLCLGWSYLPLAIPVYHGISLVIWEIKPKGCVFFCHFRKTKVFWHDAFGCFTVNYCTNYFAVLVGIICFLPKISPVQWHMTL